MRAATFTIEGLKGWAEAVSSYVCRYLRCTVDQEGRRRWVKQTLLRPDSCASRAEQALAK